MCFLASRALQNDLQRLADGVANRQLPRPPAVTASGAASPALVEIRQLGLELGRCGFNEPRDGMVDEPGLKQAQSAA